MLLYALDLMQAHLIFGHCELSFQIIFLSLKPLDCPGQDLALPLVHLGLQLKLVGLIQLLILRIAHNVLQVLVQFRIDHVSEYI